MNPEIRLTQYSHGAGCGCKLSPGVLEEILQSNFVMPDNDRLLVGNHSKDDAAVYDLGNGQALIATTDFFMPIVDDAFDFGRIASANAISDVYAMGGRPIVAIAILGWPVNQLPANLASKVIEGSRAVCREAGIPLAGGHSIDSPEPIFGLAVNGLVPLPNIKKNNEAREGDYLLLTKALGIGIITTAEKKGLLQPDDKEKAVMQMTGLNKAGEALGALHEVHALTDVTGFGLAGHLVEMAQGSGLSATLDFSKLPMLTPRLPEYIREKCIPGGTHRNWTSYGQLVSINPFLDPGFAIPVLADPQTSGGLLIAVSADGLEKASSILQQYGLADRTTPIGRIMPANTMIIEVN